METPSTKEFFIAEGESLSAITLPADLPPADTESDEALQRRFAKSACSRLWYKNGPIYEKPFVNISKPEIFIRLSAGTTGAYLRHVASGGIQFFGLGPHVIEPGGYVLSLQGTTFSHPMISACLSYN